MENWTTLSLGAWPGTARTRLRDEVHFLERNDPENGRTLFFVGATGHLVLTDDHPAPFDAWRTFVNDRPGWSYGALGYDLKNAVEPLQSRNPAVDGFPLLFWAVPRYVLEVAQGAARLHHPVGAAPGLEDEVRGLAQAHAPDLNSHPLDWQEKTDRAAYLERAAQLLAHIRRGDIYEVNYCTERLADAAGWDPFPAWERLRRSARAPHAAFLRVGQQYALCASPERFLRFMDGRVFAEPMKGTRPRDADADRDRALADELRLDVKERSENVMAVDVMRNDLSRVAAPGSVRVDELFGIRSHPGVHQLVSTVSAVPAEGVGPVDVVRAAWPMASMTGAPKLRAMELIEEAEDLRRGLFSGSIGWFGPEGTGDLNVVIRTMLYDAGAGVCSLTTGSALTALCDPEQEWEECRLKAASVINALKG